MRLEQYIRKSELSLYIVLSTASQISQSNLSARTLIIGDENVVFALVKLGLSRCFCPFNETVFKI